MRKILAFVILSLSSCHSNTEKKTAIIGMDAGVDSIVASKLPIIKHDSIAADTASITRNILAHDSAFRSKKALMPGITDLTGIDDDKSLKTFVINIKKLLASNNKMELASHIRYPLNNSIKNIKDFYRDYDKLFTPAVKEALAKTNPDRLPRIQKAVMIANGKILIAQQGNDFKIIRINN